VSFLDRGGNQIGPPAQRGTAAAYHSVTLVPDRLLLSGYARLDVTDPGISPCAGPGTVAKIRVYPPASYAAAEVTPPAGMQVCTSPNTADYIATTIGPITPTSSPN
jgi:hypothetical protein